MITAILYNLLNKVGLYAVGIIVLVFKIFGMI